MAKQIRQIEQQKETKLEDLSVNDLKALVYDRIALIEQKQGEIKNIQGDIAHINSVIAKKQSR
jgi:hypothetical protein